MDLVTLEQAKTHLRVDGADSDVEIGGLILEASSIVMDYLKKEVPIEWNAPDAEVPGTGVPGVVQAATLLVIGELFRNREAGADPISPGVESLLRRQRDPAFE
jgi:hypothetical protein